MSTLKAISTAFGLSLPPSTTSDSTANLIWAREVLQKHISNSYAVTDSKGIEELTCLNIGGVEQWIHIRGRDRNNPILLWLHGGPGGAVIGGIGDAVLRPWEDYFTLVMWDQRQTGKSYYPQNDDTNPLTVQQFIDDTEELVHYLRNYLKKDKIFLLGASWGTVLGMHMVRRCPEWLYAYIGVGQVVSSVNAERMLYDRLISHAKKQNKDELVNKVRSLRVKLDCSYPERERSFADHAIFVRRELSELARETLTHHMSYDAFVTMWNLQKLISPHLTFDDLVNDLFGDDAALNRPPYSFTKEFLDIDLPADIGSSFEVPIFFFTGVHDWQTPAVLSDEWFSKIIAPHKELIHFEQSSHCVVNEEPGKFLVKLINKVLPFAQSETNKEAQEASAEVSNV